MIPAPSLLAVLVVLLWWVPAREARAQQAWYAALGGGYIFPSGAGKVDGCDSPHRLPLAVALGGRAARNWLDTEVNARFAPFTTSHVACVGAPQLWPPRNGTYLHEDRPRALLSSRWIATDLRLRVTLPIPGSAPTLSLGHGRHWQSGRSGESGIWRSFWVGSAGLRFGLDPRWQIQVEGEAQLLHERFSTRRIVWEGGAAISDEQLGPTTEWRRTGAVALSLVVRW